VSESERGSRYKYMNLELSSSNPAGRIGVSSSGEEHERESDGRPVESRARRMDESPPFSFFSINFLSSHLYSLEIAGFFP